MMVLVDTCIWSLALRRRCAVAHRLERHEFEQLIRESRVQMVGAVRQELLSGIRVARQFEVLRSHLQPFEDLKLDTEDYETAARYFNLCRTHGIQGSNTDFLLCAVAARRDLSIFTADNDFVRFARYLPLKLHTGDGSRQL